jgi:Family of unknown function (DUF6088)
MRGLALQIRPAILARMAQSQAKVWTAPDFVDLGPRGAVDVALHRLVASKEIRRIARGLYDKPGMNKLTGKPTYPDYRNVIDALARRDQLRMVVDGLTAANDLGLTDAVPARAVVLTDSRLRPIKLGNLAIQFKRVEPSRLYWAGHPAMRVVQALHWLRDTLPREQDLVMKKLLPILRDPGHGRAIREDLRSGLPALPEWLRKLVRDLLLQANAASNAPKPGAAADDTRL